MVLGSDMRSRTVLARCGLANLIGGSAGAPPAFASASLTSLAVELGPSARGSIRLFCALLAVAAFFSAGIIAVIPSFVFSGLLMFIGGVLIDCWFVSLRRRMRRGDWLLTGGFIVVTLAFGIVVAIQVGIVVGAGMFAVSYARLKVVRATSDLRTRRSSVDRGPAQSAWLDAHGGEVKVLSLQGYLFFGSVEQLAETLRDLLDKDSGVRRIVIDLARVRDIDAAAVAALMKIERLARSRGVVVVLSDLGAVVAVEIDRLRGSAAAGTLRRAASLDEALEEAEDWLLSRMPADASGEDALTALEDMLGSRQAADRLLSRMTRQEVPAGTPLIRAGETTTDIYFVHEGQLDIHLPGGDRRGRRLRSVRGGAFVGEMANYANLPRTADVIAHSDCVVYSIDAATLDRLREEDPDLLALFHRMIASALADKVQRTNRLLIETGP
jgi:SulP family sulfate permease